ncbi:hypothetical protein JZ751_024882 [Albula glossodonta]|uniref:Uncharacterized protein n=1 Tax=Albula glossodonta TaxID=121402 RepID=A0A8T2PC82_9TELE|nr:hypothetical protein JZ751_024882 [Albula glossodonta]
MPSQVSVDKALNLPWSAFTLGLCSLNPPAAFYHGASWVPYDRPLILQRLDLTSSQSSPKWLDGFKSFPRRVHYQHMTAIVHLHAVSVQAVQDSTGGQGETLTYSLGEQAWAAVPIFTRGYCHTACYQLPLYQGSPSQAILGTLAHGECLSVLEDLRQTGELQLLKGASVFVRVADGRRSEELEQGDKDVDISQLPQDQLEVYSPRCDSTPQQIPPSLKDSFSSQLSTHFTKVNMGLPHKPLVLWFIKHWKTPNNSNSTTSSSYEKASSIIQPRSPSNLNGTILRTALKLPSPQLMLDNVIFKIKLFSF